MKKVLFPVLLVSLFAAAGCLNERPAPPPPPPDPACFPAGAHSVFLDADTRVYRQGSTIRVTPRVDAAPFGEPELPRQCVSDWSVSGPGTLSADRTTLTIAPDAPVGSIVTVGFRRGDTPVAARFRVIGRDEIVLTGARGIRAVEGCEGADRPGEVEFSGENHFSVTFEPFESYRDYWGTYEFDASTGRLRMTVAGGNFVPPGLDLEGQAAFEEGRLVLREVYLGSRSGREPQGSCTYRF